MYQLPDNALSESDFERVLTVILRRQWRGEEDQPRTLLISYVERARSEYLVKESYVDEYSGAVEPYTSAVAAADLILASQDDIYPLFAAFTRSTTIAPSAIDVDPASKTWDEWMLQICLSILHKELLLRYPEFEMEDQRRNHKYDCE